ncbi:MULTISPECIES: DUF7282 domain-containing protein [Halorussus]|uniref:DUF7282 domain-containing protein n=1 Tax=Halorussus TaxID=1070314 RepID=UPI00209F3757|nr:hypothetical protein [Halorussus vallis]USZ73830.1 hypothetical protein NGM07_10195 [Halorussus vallis]
MTDQTQSATNAVGSGTTTEAVETTTAEEVADTTTEEENGGAAETTTAEGQQTAEVTFQNQSSDGETITIESVTLPEGGFVAIHDSSLLEGDAVGSVLGNSVYLEAGTHENVTIKLARPIDETQTLIAMPHLDTNDNEVYDFVTSAGNVDGPYTADGEAVTDSATVSVGEETTTEEENGGAEETTTEAVETTTEAVETTTEEDNGGAVETTTEEVETTTEEVETTTEEVETTTEEDDGDAEETTTEAVETTTEAGEETTTEAPAGQQRFVFKIENMEIDRWSFVIGDSETPDRTETVSNITVSDRRVTINLTRILQQQGDLSEQQFTTQNPEKVEEQVEENLTGDLQTIRFVIKNVDIENVTFVVTAPANVDVPQPPQMPPEETTTEEVETTTEAVETTTEQQDGDGAVETTTEEVETTTEEVETTTEEVETTTKAVETTTEEVETTTEEEENGDGGVETTTAAETTTEAVETTTAAETTTEDGAGAAEMNSFRVSSLDAPANATAGDNITVTAVVSNPNDQESTQEVAFRLEGTVLARQSVTLGAGEQTNVSFEIETAAVPPGQYIHGVYTRNFGELGVISIESATQETTTAEGAETTTAEDAETTTEVVETETPTGNETTEAPVTTTAEA